MIELILFLLIYLFLGLLTFFFFSIFLKLQGNGFDLKNIEDYDDIIITVLFWPFVAIIGIIWFIYAIVVFLCLKIIELVDFLYKFLNTFKK